MKPPENMVTAACRTPRGLYIIVSWISQVLPPHGAAAHGEGRITGAMQGLLAPADAVAAVRGGLDGIVVSNHGGRQCDGVPSALDMLPHIAAAVAAGPRRVPLVVDGGVRRGSDIVKVLALVAAPAPASQLKRPAPRVFSSMPVP